MVMKGSKEDFLSNKQNKQKFINALADKLVGNGYTVHHAQADADLLIVQTAIECAASMKTILIGDDTDLLVLLCYHLDMNLHDVFFCPQPKKKSNNNRKWDIKETKMKLGVDVCIKLLFVYALLGCDTTSHIWGFGKGSALKKICSSKYFC